MMSTVLNEKSTPSKVGTFYEHLTCAVLHAEISDTVAWDLDTKGKNSKRIEVKASKHKYWKILVHQIDNDLFDLRNKWFVFWKWRYRKTGKLCDVFQDTHILQRYLSWNTLYGILMPGLLVRQLIKSTAVPGAFLYKSPGKFIDHYVLRETVLRKILDNNPKIPCVNSVLTKKANEIKRYKFNKYVCPTYLHEIVNKYPFKEELEEPPF